jgi:ABC-2 type transport system permease protein
MGVRFAVPVAVGALCFDLHAPERLSTYPMFACSLVLATIVCFACRFLVNAAAYWLLDARGPQMAWTLTSAILGGLYFPLWFLPPAAALVLVAGLPFASTIQIPLDVLVERGGTETQLALLGVQAGWAVAMLALCRFMQRRGERKLVVQGG